MTLAELYPARRRDVNVALIKAVRDAEGDARFEEANAAFAKALHPSVFSELDWMEISMPREQIEQGRLLVDGLFYEHLPGLLALRRAEFELDKEALLLEVAANSEFYRHVVDELPGALDGPLEREVREALRTFLKDARKLISQVANSERVSVEGRIPDIVVHRPWIIMLSSIEIQNTLARALDHLSSRERAKQLLRTLGGTRSLLTSQEIESVEDRSQFVAELRSLAGMARQYRLLRLVAVCELIADAVSDIDPEVTAPFRGERIEGFSHCARCSMMFASSAIASIDPTCPGFFTGEDGTVNIPLDFNVAICPFCGHEDRINCPSMFYSPHRNQVIYNVPTLEQYTEEEAVELHRPVIQALRERYLGRVGEAEAVAFEKATEELVYSYPEFLAAIHMGTTVPEEHVCLMVRSQIDGRGWLTDKTKKVIMALTASEVASMWASNLDSAMTAPSSDSEATLNQAMVAFESGNYERARDVLEELHRRAPSDQTRRNLAAAYLALGNREEARRVMRDSSLD